MNIELIYHTPHYPKLVERAARRCYNSFHKCDATSHKMVRGIMEKGHLSVAGHGNIVFKIENINPDNEGKLKDFLLFAKEKNNFIRWTIRDRYVVSMNILTFIEGVLENERLFDNPIRDRLLEIVNEHLELRWFYDKDVEIRAYENPYLKKGFAELGKPLVLVSDYLALKEAGLTEEELDYHSTITVEICTDRAMSFQDARHKDMMGRSEMSQRYVTLSKFEYRIPKELEDESITLIGFEEEWEDGGPFASLSGMSVTFDDMMKLDRVFYKSIYTHCVEKKKLHKLRAKELARPKLPNACSTWYIDTRPLLQWRHYFKLRDDKHAQDEKQTDAKVLKEAFQKVGVPI